MASKEEFILVLFFNEPSRHWHFENIIKESKVSRSKVNKWLKKLESEGMIQHIKPEKKMPYFIGNFEDPRYQEKKRLFALEMLERKGLLSHLSSLPNAKTIILFGSMSRWDWYKDSDIDLFIYGDDAGFDRYEYWSILGREIQVFVCKNKEQVKKFPLGLLKNIIEGYIIKGGLDFITIDYARPTNVN